MGLLIVSDLRFCVFSHSNEVTVINGYWNPNDACDFRRIYRSRFGEREREVQETAAY